MYYVGLAGSVCYSAESFEVAFMYAYVRRCTCGTCKAMPTQRESVCCQEIEQIKSLLEDSCIAEAHPSCITRHTDFNSV